MIRLGLDFDNTLITYDEIFYKVAYERNLIPKNFVHQKKAIRDFLRKNNIENEFTLLQAEVYGKRIVEAKPSMGVLDALLQLKSKIDVQFYIVSHKTNFPINGPKYNLHDSAMKWLHKNKFLCKDGLNISEKNIFFEKTKLEKIKRIKYLNCSYYIDDLPEILEMIDHTCIKIIYNPFRNKFLNKQFVNLISWNDLSKIF